MLSNPLNIQVGGNHYKNFVIQPTEYIFMNGIPFIEGNIIKYISRWRTKNGIEDLRKVIHYVELLIHLEEKKSATKVVQKTNPVQIELPLEFDDDRGFY